MGKQGFDIGLRFFQQVDTGADDLAQVMGRNICRHTHSNTGTTVEQHIGQTRRHGSGFFQGAVKIGNPVDGALPQLIQEYPGIG